MAGKVEFQSGEDLDAVFEIINEDLFEEDEDLEQLMSAVVLDIQENTQDTSFKCDFCEKVCKSKRGLSRHKNSKHKVLDHEDDIVSGSSPEDPLHPLHLKNYIIKSASKLVDENCLSARTLDHFRNYEVSLDDANYTYSFIRQIIAGYNGNAEKFYPEFYKCVSDNIAFRNLSKKCAILLGFKLATYILAHLSGSLAKENSIEFHCAKLTQKERGIAKYMSGYVFGTLYRRIRCSKQHKQILNMQSLSILLAGKSEVEDNDNEPDNILVKAKNRGGLWLVIPEVFEMFLLVESYFRAHMTAKFVTKIDGSAMVSDLISNCGILSYFSKICNKSVEKVPKEIALNLLEHILMLYIRACTFSFVKDKKELFKLEAKKKKMNSLIKSIKKTSKNLEQGH